MGIQNRVRWGDGAPTWASIRDLLTERGHVVQTRLIDGELCFPDQAPPDGWTELRVSIDKCMISLRREPGAFLVVAWSGADDAMLRAWSALTWAAAHAAGGVVEVGDGSGELTPSEFAKANGIAL